MKRTPRNCIVDGVLVYIGIGIVVLIWHLIK